MHRILAALPCLIALAACQQTTAPSAPATLASAPPGVTPATFNLPQGAGCSGEIARYRAVMDNDLATGHVGRGVYDRITGELNGAAAACSGGRDADAIRVVNATKARYGYR